MQPWPREPIPNYVSHSRGLGFQIAGGLTLHVDLQLRLAHIHMLIILITAN